MAISKLEAIQSLHPTVQFVLKGGELTWQSEDITEPTDAEITAEQERLQQESLIEQQKLIQQQVEEGQQKLLELIPEWQNPEVAAKEKAAISEYAMRELEYTPEEIQQVYDYRALLGLRNAWLNSKTVEATKKKPTQKAPARVARPGTTNRPKSAAPVKKAKQRLAKSGRVQDAAKVFEQLI